MQYAKLVDNHLNIAPVNYTLENGRIIFNFNSDTELMLENGFKPVIVAEKPDYPYVVTYEETENEIVEIITEDTEEIERRRQAEIERIKNLRMTKADFWIALLDKNITKEMVKEKINLIPDETLRTKTLIRIDDADNFWRGDLSMNTVGAMFGISSEELDYLFEHGEFPPVQESELDTNA